MKKEKHRIRISRPLLIGTAVVCTIVGIPLIFTVALTAVGIFLVVGAAALLGCAFLSRSKDAPVPASELPRNEEKAG